MKPTPTSKLALSKETIRMLTNPREPMRDLKKHELATIAGGNRATVTIHCPTTLTALD